jgi:hypothetical protein
MHFIVEALAPMPLCIGTKATKLGKYWWLEYKIAKLTMCET